MSDPCNFYFGRRGVRDPRQIIATANSFTDNYADDLHQCHLLPPHTHRWRTVTDMGTALHHSLAYGYWHGPQGLKRAYLRRRELSSKDPRRPRHVVANVDGIRYVDEIYGSISRSRFRFRPALSASVVEVSGELARSFNA